MYNKINLSAVIIVLTFILSSVTIIAQDAAKVTTNHKVLLDNEKVRVLDYQSKPGEKTPMHSHPDYLVYVLEGGTNLTTPKDGKPETTELKKGQLFWRKAVTHTAENIGKTKIHLLLIEIKEPTK